MKCSRVNTFAWMKLYQNHSDDDWYDTSHVIPVCCAKIVNVRSWNVLIEWRRHG